MGREVSRALVDDVNSRRDDLSVGVTFAAARGAEDEDLVLAICQRHSRHQSREVLVVTVVAGEDRGVIAGAEVEVLVGIRLRSGPNTALCVGVAIIVVVKIDCRPDNVFAWRQRQSNEVGVLWQLVCVARLIRVAARRRTRDALRALWPGRPSWALGPLRTGLAPAQGRLVVLARRGIIYDTKAAVMVPIAAVDHAIAIWYGRMRDCKDRGAYPGRDQDNPDLVLDGRQHRLLPFRLQRACRTTIMGMQSPYFRYTRI
jgi:hypothetical protein